MTPDTSITSVFDNILSGLETSIFTLVGFVLATFMPQFVTVSTNDLVIIGNNFRAFLVAIGGGTPWGSALADMMTADWNAVDEGAKTIALDFSEAVATALEKFGVLPQGK